MNNVKAITTHYNGYKFRSRLEARWAVFFDSLGIRYEYEPEGYEYGPRLSWESELSPKRPKYFYLPDFYLPEYDTYVECKGGAMNRSDIWKLLNFVASVGYGVGQNTESKLVLGGDWFNNEHSFPIGLYFHKGLIFGGTKYVPFELEYFMETDELGGDYYSDTFDAEGVAEDFYLNWEQERLFKGRTPNLIESKDKNKSNVIPYKVKQAYNKAKQARFEHGEKG